MFCCNDGGSQTERTANYKGMFKAHMDEGQLKKIRAAWQSGTPLGNDRFKADGEAMLGRKVGQAKLGRPQKRRALTSSDPFY